MINVDEVTASRLIFAPMGVFFGKCCGNATLKKVGRSTMSVQNYSGPDNLKTEGAWPHCAANAACTSRGV